MVRYLRWLMSAVLHCTAGHEQGVHRRRHRGDQESRQARPSAVLPHAQGASLEEERPPRSKREEEGAHEGQSFISHSPSRVHQYRDLTVIVTIAVTVSHPDLVRSFSKNHKNHQDQQPGMDGWMMTPTLTFFSVVRACQSAVPCSSRFGLFFVWASQLAVHSPARCCRSIVAAFPVLSCLVLSCFRRRPQTDLSVSNISDLQVLASPVLRCLALSSSTFPT